MTRYFICLFLMFTAATGYADPTRDFVANQTHFLVQNGSLAAHHFIVWIQHAEHKSWNHFLVSITKTRDIALLDTHHFTPMGFRHADTPLPGQKMNVPAEPDLTSMGQSLRRRIRKLFPHADQVRVEYDGHYRRVRVTEVIPRNPPGEKNRFGMLSYDDFRITPTTVESLGTGKSGLPGVLLRGHTLPEHASPLPFEVPAEFQGRQILSLVRSPFSPTLPLAQEELYALFRRELGAFVNRTDQDSEAEHWQRMHHDLDHDLMVGNDNQYWSLSLRIFARDGKGPQTAFEKLLFDFPVRELVEGSVNQFNAAGAMGIALRLTGGLDKGLTLKAITGDGQEYERTYELETIGQSAKNRGDKSKMVAGHVRLKPLPSGQVSGDSGSADKFLLPSVGEVHAIEIVPDFYIMASVRHDAKTSACGDDLK